MASFPKKGFGGLNLIRGLATGLEDGIKGVLGRVECSESLDEVCLEDGLDGGSITVVGLIMSADWILSIGGFLAFAD